MVKINLLPAGLIAERARKKGKRRFLLVWGLIVLLLAAGQGFLYIIVQEVEDELATVQMQRAAVDAEIATYQKYVDLRSEVDSLVNRLQLAMGSPLPWAQVVAEVGEWIPPNVWLTDMALSQPSTGEGGGDAPGQLTVRGITYDHPSTANWVESLRELSGVKDVYAMFSQKEGQQEDVQVRFEIRVTLLPGPRYDPLIGGGEAS